MQIRPQFGNQQALLQQRRQNMELIEQTLAPLVPNALKTLKSAESARSRDASNAWAIYGNAVLANYISAASANFNRTI